MNTKEQKALRLALIYSAISGNITQAQAIKIENAKRESLYASFNLGNSAQLQAQENELKVITSALMDLPETVLNIMFNSISTVQDSTEK